MQAISILLLPDSSMMNLSCVLDPLRAANRLSRQPLFKWKLISVTGGAVKLTSGISIDCDCRLTHEIQGDTLIVIAGFDQQSHLPNSMLPTLRAVANKHKTIMAIEAGSWLIARAGIVASQRMTTHWEDIETFAERYPSIEVVLDRYVIDGRIWSSGGASPSLDMMLEYIRRMHHRSLAVDVANVFIYSESHVASDAQLIEASGNLERLSAKLAKAVRLMEANIEDPLAVSTISARIGVSAKSMEQLFKRHLECAPYTYYLRLRLQRARRLVLDSHLDILEIAIRCGFNNASSFSRAFKQRFETSPSQLRKAKLTAASA